MDVLFSQSRYEEQGSGDYLNAPLNKEEYEAFIEALTTADRVVLKDFEGGDLFQACQPAEEVARTGKDAIRFGAMNRRAHRPAHRSPSLGGNSAARREQGEDRL